MRISFFILDITTGGGIERTTTLLSNLFVQKGHQVTIVSAFRQNQTPIFRLDTKVDVVYFLDECYTHDNSIIRILRQYFKVIKATKNYYKENKFDVIIGQAFLACFFLWITGNASRAFVCEHFKYGVYNRWVRAFRDMMYHAFCSVVVLTKNDAQQYRLKRLKVFVIPNVVPFNCGKYEKEKQSKRIISVGHLHPSKGYDLLLPALKPVFAKHPDWHIDIYGEGADRKMLENLRDSLGLTNYVSFPGFVRDIQTEYLHSSFYVMSSRYEGLPMVLLEAMACGLPIVSYNCKEGPSVLLSDNAGYLVPPENIPEMSRAICCMIEDEALRESYAKKALEVIKNYAPEVIYDKWIRLFHLYGKSNKVDIGS